MTTFRGLTILTIATLLLGIPAVAEDKKENKLPDQAQAILDKADQFDLLSLDPASDGNAKEGFHGWKVLGKTVVKDAEVRKQILVALQKGISETTGNGAKCFDPRHGIRATADGKTVDLVICFACSWIYVYYEKDKDRQGVAVTTGKPQETFDKVLKDAGVPLPKAAKE